GSMARFRRPVVRSIARWMFGRLAFVAAQDDAYAACFRELGVPASAVFVPGSLKYDTADIADTVAGADELAAAMGIRRDRPVWVAGSTGPNEETILLDALATLAQTHPGVQLVLVPRKPERFDDVAALVEQRGHACVRRSRCPDGAEPGGATNPIFLGDTMGELRKFYALADVVFVGRSLVPMGGSDLLEPAALAKPILVGPHMENFAEPVRCFEEAGALVCVRDAETMAVQLSRRLADRDAARAVGLAGREVVRRNQGATQRTVDRLCRTLGRGADSAGELTPDAGAP
ncbi:MAG: glycosyltransferase N-terminal domain-containing protein, partial [Phycisphaerae bacterium]